jgi:hypothetical protein
MSRTSSGVIGGTLFAAALMGGAIHASRPQTTTASYDTHAMPAISATGSLAAQVREATADYRDINQAIAAGYAQFGGCVSGPEAGAMGVHFVKGALVDATLDANEPEALVYEMKDGVARLVGVEYITPVDAWDAAHDGPPILAGQHFHLLGSPNRYRMPALYTLHVWAWRHNPNGTFVDWNPRVSCD